MNLSPNATPLTAPERPPPSCVGWWDSFIGLAALFAVFLAFRHAPVEELSHAMLALYMLAATGLTLGLIEIARAPWRRIPPPREPFKAIFTRAAVKYIGFLAGLAFVGFFYWLFPEYRRPFYKSYFDVLALLAPWIPLVFAVYFLVAERFFPAARDGSWQAGMLVLGRWKEIDRDTLWQNILGWIVKGFFLPIMFGDLVAGMSHYRFENWALWELNFAQIYHLLFRALMSLELVFVVCGYALGCRLFNSHMRAVENTMLGWWAALITYGPFMSLFFTRYFSYRDDGIDWNQWLPPGTALHYIWGGTIILLMLLHMWCDACFGVRFSNLTHRGIITNGCYRFCKHPAYLIKNLRWWMVAVPFVWTGSPLTSLRLSIILVLVNMLYMVRCYTEERLLSRDPVYQHYALWMDRHGWFAWIGRLVPFLKYENRLRRWQQQGILKPLPKEEYAP